VKIGKIFAAFKAWSNFRLMVLIGSAVTVLSLFAGALYVQASISNAEQESTSEASNPGRSVSDSRASGTTATPAPSPSVPPSPPGELARATETQPPIDRGAGFTVECTPVGFVPAGGTAPLSSCLVTSYNGFVGRVDLSCGRTPPELSCQFAPRSVIPRANRSVPVQLKVSSSRVAPGSYVFDVVGRSGTTVNSSSFPLGITPPAVVQAPPPLPVAAPTPAPSPSPSPSVLPGPTFSIACTLQPGPDSAIDRLLWSLTQGSKGTIKCLVEPKNGFDEEVTLSLANESDQIIHAFNPPLLKLADGVSSFVDLNFELGALEEGKEYTFDVTGTSATQTLVKRVVLTVTE